MKFIPSSLFLVLIAINAVEAARRSISYDGYKVLRVTTLGKAASVHEKLSSLSYSEWDHNAHHIDIALAPDQLDAFDALGLEHSTMHEDLGSSIAAESVAASPFTKRQADDLSWFDSYHSYADHKQYWADLHASFPDNSEPITSGTSYENRSIFGLHLWGADGPGKPAVLWHGTVHAREWITSMTLEYLAHQLITGYAKTNDTLTRSFLDKYDFYILPFVNPDGFVYTQTTNRLWRKNRQPGGKNSTCFGRDINRQWPFKWDGNPLGASDDPCDETYHGEAPADGPEIKGLAAYVDKLRDANGIKLYIDWHSYSQLIEFPFGYNCTLFPPEAGKFTNLALRTSDAIYESEGTVFIFGQACSSLYPTEGGSRDHIYAVGEADWSYTIEGRDRGQYGFVLPPEQIKGAVEEQWNGQKVMLSLLDEEFFDGEGPA